MMVERRFLVLILAGAAVVAAWTPPAPAQENSWFSMETSEEWKEEVNRIKNPTDWLSWGADLRLREIYAPNLVFLGKSGMEKERHFQRYRGRLWATLKPATDIDLNVRLVYEPRHYCQPGSFDDPAINEIIIDKLNVEWRNIGGLPVTAKVGRQDIIFGNGWLVLDGAPLTGSRVIHFDAARLTWQFDEIATTVDTIYIDQHADSDRWLKPINDKDVHNREQDERGVIVYVTNKSLENTEISGYFIYKQDRSLDPGTWAPLHTVDADIYTFGGRVAGRVDDCWEYRAELAGQFGSKNIQAIGPARRRDLCTLGFNSSLTYLFNDEWNSSARVSYEYLSGDDPSTDGTDEQFDPLWGRWPQFSELYVYPVVMEARPGEASNLHRIGAGYSTHPSKELELCADYHLLFTDKNTFGRNGTGLFGGGPRVFSKSGCFRGQILAGLLRYKFNEHVSGHLLAELFFPGDYYDDNNNDVAGFFRYELTFTW